MQLTTRYEISYCGNIRFYMKKKGHIYSLKLFNISLELCSRKCFFRSVVDSRHNGQMVFLFAESLIPFFFELGTVRLVSEDGFRGLFGAGFGLVFSSALRFVERRLVFWTKD